MFSERVFRTWDYTLFFLLIGGSSAVILYFIWHWFSDRGGVASALLFYLFTLVLALKVAEHYARLLMLPLMSRPRPVPAQPGYRVAVVTTFVPEGEQLEMLEQTVRALCALAYPHETWVLDEGDDDRVRGLCARLGAHHFSRKPLAQYQTDKGRFQSRSKHGNYNAWLWEVGFERYDVIAAFDPDHVPREDFLLKVLGYFEDPGVGYVQAPAAYYNQRASFIAAGAAEETYAYYSCTQMAAYGLGHPFVTGCHNTHRVAALREVGGFAPHDADDLLITLLYKDKGWRGVYVPQILARGLAPVDWAGYLTQQVRWSRSIADVKLRRAFGSASGVSVKDRLVSLLDVCVYLQSSLVWLVCLVLLLMMLATDSTLRVPAPATLYRFAALCLALQLCVFYRQRFYLDPKREGGIYWKARVLRYAKWPYTLLALVDVLRARRVPYALTRKVGGHRANQFLLWPHAVVALLFFAMWLTAVLGGRALPLPLHLVSAAVVIGSFALVYSERMSFPDPYEESPDMQVGRSAGSLS